MQAMQKEVLSPAADGSRPRDSLRRSHLQARPQQLRRQVADLVLPKAGQQPLLRELQQQPSLGEQPPEVLLAKGDGLHHEKILFCQ